MRHDQLSLETRDGAAETHAFFPDGPGPFPPVIVYMDGIGMRPAMHEIAQRVAAEGYYALLPNIFYRVPEWKNMDAHTVFSDPPTRNEVMTKVIPSANASNAMRDTEAWIAHLDAQKIVKHGAIGATGFCMGGRLAITAAGTFPERVAAAAAFHPAGLATDTPDSPHLLAPKIKAKLYIGGATDDRGFDDEQKARLRKALTDAHVDFTLETVNAKHGWVPSDTPAYDRTEAERAYATMKGLMRAKL